MKTKINKLNKRNTSLHRLVAKWLVIFESDGVLWEVLTALRSQDSSADTDFDLEEQAKLKNFTTERLRAILGLTFPSLKYPSLFFPASRQSPLTAKEQKLRDELLEKVATEHFQQHWAAAVRAVVKYLHYDLNTETPLKGYKPIKLYKEVK